MFRKFFFYPVAIFAFVQATFSPAPAQGCPEYFTREWGDPIDMDNREDVLFNIVPAESKHLSPYQFLNGIFSVSAAGEDPWFRLLTATVPGSIPDFNTTRYGQNRPIDPAQYSILKLMMWTDQASDIQVFWEKIHGSWAISNQVFTTPGWQEYTINLNTIGANFGSGPSFGWATGLNTGLRIDPTRHPSAQILIDWIRLTRDGCTPSPRIAPFVQPDLEGGDDYFIGVRGNASNMDSPADIDQLAGTSSAFIQSGSEYTDSSGAVRSDDFLEAVSQNGNGDPVNVSVFDERVHKIDASRYKIACWTLDLLKSVRDYHSVARVFWKRDGTIWTGDDVINKTNGESRYCVRMDTMQTEPALAPGVPHPWRNNSDGSGLDLFRIDPHEEVVSTRYRVNDIRLATDHIADQRFALVVVGNLDRPIDIFYNSVASGEALAGKLAAGRSSNVLLWNSSNVPNGFYSFRSVVDGNSFAAPGIVSVEHGSGLGFDGQAPILKVFAPTDGHRFENALDLSGYALDNRRLATVEVLLDNTLINSFIPNSFDKEAHDTYPNMPFASSAGFRRSVDVSGFAYRSYTLTIKAYDTGGNVTTHTASVTKARDNLTPPYVSPPLTGAQTTVPLGVRPKPGQPAPPPTGLQSTGVDKISTSIRGDDLNLSFTTSNCAMIRVFASARGPAAAQVASSASPVGSFSGGALSSVKAAAKNLPTFVSSKRGAKSKVYLMADCGEGTKTVIKSFDARRIASRKRVSNLQKVISRISKAMTRLSR